MIRRLYEKSKRAGQGLAIFLRERPWGVCAAGERRSVYQRQEGRAY